MKQLIMHKFKQIGQLTTVILGERECSVKAENKDGDIESSEGTVVVFSGRNHALKLPDLNRVQLALTYLSIDDLMDETEKLTGISTGGNSNHAVALHPADLEVSSSAEVKTTDLGGEVQGLDPGQRSIRRKLKSLERLACGFTQEEAATSSHPLIILGKGDLSVGAEQVPSFGPTMATQLGFGWTEKQMRRMVRKRCAWWRWSFGK